MSDVDTEAHRSGASLRAQAAKLPIDLADAIPSGILLKGHREVVILHAGERYRLRLTANDKLILTK